MKRFVLPVALVASIAVPAVVTGKDPADFMVYPLLALLALAVHKPVAAGVPWRERLPGLALIVAVSVPVAGATLPGHLTRLVVAQSSGFGALEYAMVIAGGVMAWFGVGAWRRALPVALLPVGVALALGGQLIEVPGGGILNAAVAATAIALLRLLGFDAGLVTSQVVEVNGPGGSGLVEIAWACSGVAGMLVVGFTIAALWPALAPRPKARLVLVAGAMAGFWALNVVRIMVLVAVFANEGAKTMQETHTWLGDVFLAAYLVALFAVVPLRRPAKDITVMGADASAPTARTVGVGGGETAVPSAVVENTPREGG